MLSTIRETVEVKDDGLLQLHVKGIKPFTKISVVAVMEIPDFAQEKPRKTNIITKTSGLLNGRIPDPMNYQRELRDEWEIRLKRETAI